MARTPALLALSLAACAAPLPAPAPPPILAPPVEPAAGAVVATPPPPPPPALLAVVPDAPRPRRSSRLSSGLSNPMSGGVFRGYAADTGLDIAGFHKPVFALAAGTLDYAEEGHTRWTGRRDSHLTIRFKLDEPIPFHGRQITHVYYGHMAELAYTQREGSTERRHVDAGEQLGISGVARGSPHLHVGLLLDGEIEQEWGTFLLEDEVREVLGGYRNGARLPTEPVD